MKIVIVLGLLIASFSALSQQKEVVIDRVAVAGQVHMLTGRGGNVGLSIGKDGVFMVDDQFAAMSDPLSDAIREVSASPIKFLLNTHWHGDHVGGNQNF